MPYTTRLLVRYPTNPAKFNGTVVFEWLNDTTGGDQDPVWAELYTELLDQGYAYVGVTAQTAGMSDLKTWDPARYGALGDSNDGQSYDIFTQAAQAVTARQRHAARRAHAEEGDRRRRFAVGLPGRHLRERGPTAHARLQRLPRRRSGRDGGADRQRADLDSAPSRR